MLFFVCYFVGVNWILLYFFKIFINFCFYTECQCWPYISESNELTKIMIAIKLELNQLYRMIYLIVSYLLNVV